jgi:hypothetical protein
MAEIDIPLVHRSAEALAALFDHNDARARNSVRLLTFSELLYLAVAADQLAALARAVRHETWPNPGPRLKGMVAEVGEHARDESSGTDRPWPICWAQHQGMLCDRKQGHDGDHVDIYGPLADHTWPREQMPAEPSRGGTVATEPDTRAEDGAQ